MTGNLNIFRNLVYVGIFRINLNNDGMNGTWPLIPCPGRSVASRGLFESFITAGLLH